jgi:hypothetical protein
MIKSKLNKIRKGVYHLEYENYFDMGMSFLRMQEHYESSSDDYKGKFFDVFEYMRYYTQKEKKQYFSYTDDYVGYNIPSYVIDKFIKRKDLNLFEKDLFYKISKIKNKKYYLIASKMGVKDVLDHELAHALFYINEEYRLRTTELVLKIPSKTIKQINNKLRKMGYSDSVYIDETQAYLATGLTKELRSIKGITKYRNNFKKIFSTFNNLSKGV